MHDDILECAVNVRLHLWHMCFLYKSHYVKTNTHIHSLPAQSRNITMIRLHAFAIMDLISSFAKQQQTFNTTNVIE